MINRYILSAKNSTAKDSPLISAILQKDVPAINEILETKPEINYTNCRKETALIWAAYNGLDVVIKSLLEVENLDINLRDISNRNAIMWAIRNGHERAVELLVDRINDINPQCDGNTLLDMSMKCLNIKIALMLLQRNAIANYPNDFLDAIFRYLTAVNKDVICHEVYTESVLMLLTLFCEQQLTLRKVPGIGSTYFADPDKLKKAEDIINQYHSTISATALEPVRAEIDIEVDATASKRLFPLEITKIIASYDNLHRHCLFVKPLAFNSCRETKPQSKLDKIKAKLHA